MLINEEKWYILNKYVLDINFFESEFFEILKIGFYFLLLCKIFGSNKKY